MRKILLAAAALGGLTAVAGFNAVAAPSAPRPQVAQSRTEATQVDYYWHNHHYKHRRFADGRWHYWN